MIWFTGTSRAPQGANAGVARGKWLYLSVNITFIVSALIFEDLLEIGSGDFFFKVTYFFFLIFILGQVGIAGMRPGDSSSTRLRKAFGRGAKIAVLGVTGLAVWLLISQYLLCPQYDFSKPVPFSGKVIHNPYDSIDPAKWAKCNFHAHARAWKGVTNGHGAAGYLHSIYKATKYDFHCVSNYHQIDTTLLNSPYYIPAYEHGYNMLKTHQLVLGSWHVEWLDYLFPQTVHNQQHVINNLSEWDNVVIINHPAIRNGYASSALALLTGYNCMEVLNPSVISDRQWDMALSAGRRVWVAGNDDMHNALKKERLGMMCTFVNVRSKSGNRVLEALREGAAFAVKIGQHQQLDSIPLLESVHVRGDSVSITMSAPANAIAVTGQEGRAIATFSDCSKIAFRIKPEDHYARAVFHYRNGTSVYLNPVTYMPAKGYVKPAASINWRITSLYRLLGVLALNFWLLYCRRKAFAGLAAVNAGV